MKKAVIIFTLSLFAISCNNKPKNMAEIPDSRSRIIQSSEINNKIKKGKDIVYKNVTVIGDIDFTQAGEVSIITGNLVKSYVNSGIVFYDCTFKGKIIAEKDGEKVKTITNFSKGISFINCTFQDTVNFTSSDFKDIVNFSNSIFQDFVSFKSTFFGSHGLIFSKTHFIKGAEFNMMNVSGSCNFSDAVFDDNVLFQLCKFNGYVRFASSVFNKNADFSRVKFNDDVFFNYAEFYRTLNFGTSVFKGRAEFIKSKFNMISEFKNCLFYSYTNFTDAEVKGILTFENSIFYISDAGKFNVKLSEGTDYILKGTQTLLKKP